ncbi:MAG: hypothetical protein AVDCRST_MAG70-1754 [uncultured Thermomicrobiales bacterium]|uniref:Uncharacterized protein n=1 Tax=uncultured Thermomicrobiales bacterium TaxID=1645740 RepID=A0A6J4UW71_9BACT|nr:MAG: hypothetical protein AVDCRST_MAG70-1754 [uncultured Thermomicrobiales bacterium]
MAALAAAAGLYVLWVVAVNGAVSPGVLANETGTALAPLTTLVGPGVHVAGGIFVILAMGMASIQQALGLSYQVREWLPTAGPMLPSDGVPVPAPWSRAGVGRALAGPRWRGAMGMAPIVIIFLVVEWLFITGQESFAGLLGFIGAVVGPIVAGVFSMLMLVAARRKGDYAVDGGWRFLGSRAVVWVVCALFLTSVVFHGLFAWDDLLRRGVALVVSAVVVGLIVAIRRDAYVPRAVIEVREEAGAPGDPVVNVVARGVPVPVEVGWSRAVNRSRGGPGGDRTMSLHLPALPVREVKVWAHRLDPEGVSEARPARVAFHRDDGHGDTAAVALSGHLIVPSDGTSARVEITLPPSGDSPRTVARPR